MTTAAKTCPMCKRPTETAFKPFCSKRCADLDLQRWLTGGYAIAARPEDDESDGEAMSEPDRSED